VGTKAKPARTYGSAAKPHNTVPLPKSSTPAVIRRSGILSGGQEPVVQRRR
jgi:hypothetical protein